MPPSQIGGYRYRKRKKTAMKYSKQKSGGSKKRTARKTKRRRNIKRTKRNSH